MYAAESLTDLAARLADVLADPVPDPMSPELLGVTSFALGRWLRLELAARLGTGPTLNGAARGDGVAANFQVAFPDTLRRAVLAAGRPPGTDDPWDVERLAWTLVEVSHEVDDDPAMAPFATIADGATRYGIARRVADLFDRYSVHRPTMISAWAAGDDLDGDLEALDEGWAWQPHLWRLARARIGHPSAPELLPGLLAQVRTGELELALPPRVSLFGLTTLPGGSTFLDVVEAVATRHAVGLFFLTPSPGLVDAVRALVGPTVSAQRGPGPRRRAHDPTVAAATHPLVRSWARPNREAIVLIADAESSGRLERAVAPTGSHPTPATLLARLQADIRECRAPAGDLDPGIADRSIEVHSCHGATRQAEVLRDVILGRLAADPDLSEDDILVVCPSIDTFAPLVEAAFGPAAPRGRVDEPGASGAGPRLSYHVTDRALRETHPTLSALGALVDLIAGRFSASEVLDFLALAPVRRRFDLGDDDLTVIARWVADGDLRWGIDGPHREAWGIPASFSAGSWRAALDRLMMGIAVSDGIGSLAVGDVVPLGVEGSDVATAGRLHDVIDRLAALEADVSVARPPGEWCDLLLDASEDLFAAPPGEPWQRAALVELLGTLAHESEPASVAVTLGDIRRALADRLTAQARRSDFFRGGITVSSLTPLQGIPFRLVCVLGLDDGAFGAAPQDGDDLVTASPHLGDRDARAETRQALLQAVLAAEALVVIHSGHDVVTNQPRPPAVPLAELRDAVVASVVPDARDRVRRRLDIDHPRQAFAAENFGGSAAGSIGPWSFDPIARAGAQARLGARAAPMAFLSQPLPDEPLASVELADLIRFLQHPVREFLTARLELALPRDPAETSEDLRTKVVALDEWKVADRLLNVVLDGGDTPAWQRREVALGSLPPGAVGRQRAREIASSVHGLAETASSLGFARGRARVRTIGVTLDDGTRLVGTVADAAADHPGPLTLTYSKFAPQKLLVPWLELMALVADDPATPWRSVLVCRNPSGSSIEVTTLRPVGDGPEAAAAVARTALAVALDCLRRGRRAPIPLFKALSRRVYDDKASTNDWHNRGGWADGDNPANRLVYGDLDLATLLDIPADEGDPPGRAAGRVERFAQHLWGAMEQSTERETVGENG